MPLPNITVPLFPDVPNVPGVPPLNRALNFATLPQFSGVGGLPLEIGILIAQANAPNGLIVADAPNLPVPRAPDIWGLFDVFGQPIAIADSIVAVDYRNEMRISNYPQEQGAFASYNKVGSPYDARVKMAKGGTTEERAAFLNAIDAAFKSLNFYQLVTPEITYYSASVVHYDYRREARNGAHFLLVDVWIEEVRITATITFTNTIQVSGQNQQNGGVVQATAVPASVAQPVTQ